MPPASTISSRFRLEDAFVDRYAQLTPPWGPIGEIIFLRTYSRWLESEGRREYWHETVRRVVEYSTDLYRGPASAESRRLEAERLFDLIWNLRAFPSGRTLWVGGTDYVRTAQGAVSNFNCAFEDLGHSGDFHDLVVLLMSGCGVGFRVTADNVAQLNQNLPFEGWPCGLEILPYQHVPGGPDGTAATHDPATGRATIVVGDSREGWARAVQMFLEVATSGRLAGHRVSTLVIDANGVRPLGAKLKTFGGKASGPEPLLEFFRKGMQVLRAGGPGWTDLKALDLATLLGQTVVAGGTRRSALIALGDSEDFCEAKGANWWDKTPWRRQANNSKMYFARPDRAELERRFQTIQISGEVGLVNGEAAARRRPNFRGFNPCQPASATVITPAGLTRFGDISEGDLIWSETGWTKVTRKWSTGVKPVFRYRTTAGVFVGTENHRIVQAGVKVEVGSATAIDRLRGPAPAAPLTHDPQLVMDGLVVGDGSVHRQCREQVYLCVGRSDGDYAASEVGELVLGPHPSKRDWALTVTTGIGPEELPPLPGRVIPDRYVFAGQAAVASFLRGLYSANGSVVGGRVTLKAASRGLIDQAQVMLSSLGIGSYVTTNRAKVVRFANGDYECRQSYDLNITSGIALFAEHIGFLQEYKNRKLAAILAGKTKTHDRLAAYEIRSRDYLGDDEVFDITVENDPHTYWTGGLNVSNCVEVAMDDHGLCNLATGVWTAFLLPDGTVDREALERAYRLLVRHTLRITNVDMEASLPEWHRVQQRDRLLGVSFTGWGDLVDATGMDGAAQAELLAGLRAVCEDEATTYALEMNVPRPLLVTTVKPEGTISNLPGVSSGIHAPHAPRYVRRVRISSSDAVAQALRMAGFEPEPDLVEADTLEGARTWVFSFPVSTPAVRAGAEIPALEQLERYRLIMEHWCDHNASNTISFTPDEVPAIVDWLLAHWDEYVAVSFLPRDGGSYRQMPYEALDEAAFEAFKAGPCVGFAGLVRGYLDALETASTASEDLDDACQTGACPTR